MSRQDAANVNQPGLLPLIIAGMVCLVIAGIIGYSGWLFYYSRYIVGTSGKSEMPPSLPVMPSGQPSSPMPCVSPSSSVEYANVRPVEEGIVALGGGDTGLPPRQEMVSAFAIAETEVTNQQYYEFISETGHRTPDEWKNGTFLPGTAQEPVTGVTWHDAVDYCSWLSNKIGTTVRLPNEAEWERAARGKENFKYPWGNEWKDSAATCKEMQGQVRAVKSYPDGRSPFGAYDMAGNVWEWIDEEAMSKKGETLKIIKGGAANDYCEFVSATTRAGISPHDKEKSLGFRYIVVRKVEAK